MGKLKILGSEGHAELAYALADPPTIPPARDRFDELRRKGFHAFAIPQHEPGTPEPPAEKITEFDPEAGEIVMFPQVQGG